METAYDAVVVGAGPNGLAAAIALAMARQRVVVIEAAPVAGGGLRSEPLTLPGVVHDLCAAVLPFVRVSPFLRALPLGRNGLGWVESPFVLAHPFEDGTAAVLSRRLDETAARLAEDGPAYRRLLEIFVDQADPLFRWILGPLRWPSRPALIARFGLVALQSAQRLANTWFRTPQARALFAGVAAHGMLPLDQPPSAAFGLVLLLLAHTVGWPLPRGGAQRVADALVATLLEYGGELRTNTRVTSLAELPRARALLLDLAPPHVLSLARPWLPVSYRRWLRRYRFGPGVCKVDYVLDGPVPWRAVDCHDAATVHLGGTAEEIAEAERAVAHGQCPDRPFVILVQPSRFDPTRAPGTRQVVWAYCHVPAGSDRDLSAAIEEQIERFAPGFRKRILARHVQTAAQLAEREPNMIGGDINCGVMDLRQLFFRPAPRRNPYATPHPQLFLCSSATPPGGGVHGMCGYWAARSALARLTVTVRER